MTKTKRKRREAEEEKGARHETQHREKGDMSNCGEVISERSVDHSFRYG